MSDQLPLDVDYGGAVPGGRAVPPDQHPWAPSVIDDWDVHPSRRFTEEFLGRFPDPKPLTREELDQLTDEWARQRPRRFTLTSDEMERLLLTAQRGVDG